MLWQYALDFVLKHEGEYVNDPHDPGGETKFGISKRAYPHLDIASLTKEQAAEIYQQDYWARLRCDEMPGSVAIAVFDTAVNCGKYRVAIWLQNAINVVGRHNLLIDGIIGPKTSAALKACNPYKLLLFFLSLRLKHYANIPENKYLRGWINRVVDLMRLVGE